MNGLGKEEVFLRERENEKMPSTLQPPLERGPDVASAIAASETRSSLVPARVDIRTSPPAIATKFSRSDDMLCKARACAAVALHGETKG